VIEFLEGIYLALEHAFFWLTLNGPDVDDFDGHLFFTFIVASPIDY